MEINLDNKKVIFVDLDNTLIIYHQDSHNKKACNLLQELADKGKLLVLVTFNLEPEHKLKIYGFDASIFTRIYKPEIVNALPRYIKKSHSISRFLEKHEIDKEHAIFFDDLYNNVYDVGEFGVESVLIDPRIGMPFDRIVVKKNEF